jgi:hypothetical protein
MWVPELGFAVEPVVVVVVVAVTEFVDCDVMPSGLLKFSQVWELD